MAQGLSDPAQSSKIPLYSFLNWIKSSRIDHDGGSKTSQRERKKKRVCVVVLMLLSSSKGKPCVKEVGRSVGWLLLWADWSLLNPLNNARRQFPSSYTEVQADFWHTFGGFSIYSPLIHRVPKNDLPNSSQLQCRGFIYNLGIQYSYPILVLMMN